MKNKVRKYKKVREYNMRVINIQCIFLVIGFQNGLGIEGYFWRVRLGDTYTVKFRYGFFFFLSFL